MKFLLRVMLAFGCWLAMVAHAEAAPVRCSYGYQDSTCTTPIRNGPIPQPQCSTGPGWATVSVSVWQGSHWSTPQCNYVSPPTCPPGYNQTSAPRWDGAAWTSPGCAAPPPPQPTTRDWAQICNDYLIKTRTGPIWRYTFKPSDFNPFTFGTGVATMIGGGWGTGPYYINGDYSGNDWNYFCAVRVDDGTVYQFYETPMSGYQGG